VATFPEESLAVTVKLLAVPAIVGEGYPVTVKIAAPAEFTVIPACTPVMLDVTVSVAVRDCVAAVLNVALKVCTPASPTRKV
jgi:hypothetical protein